MPIARDLTITFSANGNSRRFLGGGWAMAEADFAWSIGAESHIVIPCAKLVGDSILTLDVVPFLHPPALTRQRLTVSVNGTVVGDATVTRPSLLAYRVPAGLADASDRLLITLHHPDAARPSVVGDSADDRDLALAVSEVTLRPATDTLRSGHIRLPAGLTLAMPRDGRDADLAAWATRQTGLTVPQIAMQFESVGENCEFGLWQRRCEAEPLGLLRFSSTFMRNLIRGIDNGFEGLGDIASIQPILEGQARKEYMIHESTYGLVYHTFVYEGERAIWLLKEQESARLTFLRRKFMEELDGTEKIFVYKFFSMVNEAEIFALYLALNRRSPATLLWTVVAEPDRPAGTVEVLMPGLLKGYIDRFAPSDNAHDLSFDGWLRVCTNALVLARLATPAAIPIPPDSD